MDVLMVSEVFPPHCSGGGWSTYHLANAFAATDDIDVTVLAVNQDEVEDEGLDVEQVDVPRLPNERAYRAIAEEIRKREDDYDVVQGQHSLTVPPLAHIDTPTVGVIRDYWPVCYRTTLRDRWGSNHRSCGARCLASTALDWHALTPYKLWNHHHRARLTKQVDMLAARSEFVEDRLNDHGFDDTTVKYNFVPDGFGDGIDPEGEGDVLYVGKLVEQKGPQLVVDAIPDVLEEQPDQRFTFLGDGPMRDELENRVEELGVADHVDFRGHVDKDEVIARMKGARVVASPSLWHEPLSRVVIEAQAVGTPVVTTDRGGNKEGVNGENVSSVEEIASALKNSSSTSEDSSLSNNFLRQTVVSEWKNLYNSLHR